MKTFVILIIGLCVGAAVGGGIAIWSSSSSARLLEGVVRMQGDGVLLLGNEAAKALNTGSPESFRDFANYVLDSSLIRARSGTTSGAYIGALDTSVASISSDRRSLSKEAPALYVAARKQLADK